MRVLLILALFVSGLSFSQGVAVTWEGLKSAAVNAASITKSGNGIGYATSTNLLYGMNGTGYNDGSFNYVVPNTSEIKKIGFAVTDSYEPVVNHLDYAFDFKRNGVLKLVSPHAIVNMTYTANDNVKLSREGEKMRYYKNNVVVHEVQVDPYEKLVVRCQLKGNNTSFTGVETSFNTSAIDIVATLNHVNNEIALAATGTNGPFSYAWSDGENTSTSKKFLDGTYEVAITDNSGNTIKRSYSIGTDVAWSEFDQTTQTTKVLSKVSGMKWGSAKSTSSILSTDNAWVEYIVEEQADQKALGFVKSAEILRNFTDLDAGFIVSKNRQVQIVDQGRITTTLDHGEQDVLRIERKDNSYTWHINDKEVHASTTTAQALKIGGLVRGSATLKGVHYFVNELTPVTFIWDETTGKGAVTVDVSAVTGATGPFHYLISENNIPPLRDIYVEIRDELFNGVLDEVGFLGGNDVNTIKTFQDLGMGTYFVSVFDNDGGRVFQKQVDVHPEFTFEQQIGLVVEGEKIKSTTVDAKGSLDIIYHFAEDWEINLEEMESKGEMIIGLVKSQQTYNDITDVDFGFYINKSELQTIESGVKSVEKFIINKDTKLRIRKRESTLELRMSDERNLKTIPLQAQENYKLAMELKESGSSLKKKPKSKLSRPYYDVKVIPGSCNGSFGEVEVKIFPVATAIAYQHSFDVTLYDSNNNPLTASSGPTIFTFSNLVPGQYTGKITYLVTNSISGQTTSHLKNFAVQVDSRMLWTNFSETSYEMSDESLTRISNSSGNSFGTAVSRNEIGTNFPYYIDFNLKFNSALNVCAMEWGNANQVSGTWNSGIAFVRLPIWSNWVLFLVIKVENGTGIAYETFFPSDRFKYQIENNGQAKLFKISSNNNLTPVFSFSPVQNINYLWAKVRNLESGFSNISTNMECPVQNIHAKLERRLTGVKYKTYLNKVYFYYDEEYESQTINLNYKVFSTSDRVTPVINGAQNPENLIYGDNRYELDVTNLVSGAYILEVENDKKEKFYLRFIK
ncbi:MAG: hypothetical protein JKY09_09290 [Crocinitomicaceae bacterium]|nr:hypothetical protein [Crocinitomicaceae bacterium]